MNLARYLQNGKATKMRDTKLEVPEAEEMEDERKHHQEELAERDFTADQTRKKYQGKTYYSLLMLNQHVLIVNGRLELEKH